MSRNISEIYKEYKIMPNLQDHMFRVAGVAVLVCDNMQIPIKREELITACLLHDMGNIIKFNLNKFPEFLEPEGLEYWQGVQNEYFEKYGHDEHHATIDIARELGVSEDIIDMINSISFLGAPDNAKSEDMYKKIPAYVDDRVDPFGVVSLEGRFIDLRNRYSSLDKDTEELMAFEKAMREIEQQIFAKCSIKPEDINNEKVNPLIPDLKNFMIK